MIDRYRFFNAVRKLPFRGLSQSQVDGLSVLLDKWEATGWDNLHWLAYGLSTAYHETDRTMQPIREEGSQEYLSHKPYWPYYGRGYVQLTWQADYVHATKELLAHGLIDSTIDLSATPELALRPDIAADILWYGMKEGWFTGRKFEDYFVGNFNLPIPARFIVNGTDRATLIAGYYYEFLNAITLKEDNMATINPAPTTTPAPRPMGFLDPVRNEIDSIDNVLDQMRPLLSFIPLMSQLVAAADAIRRAVDTIDPKV